MTYRSKIAVVFLLGFFLDLINMFIASVAFPAMARAFNTTPSALAWVSNGYIAGLTLVIPFSSILTRRVGPKRVILLSLLLFSAASVAAGLSSSLESLIAWRVVQGAGGGLLIPVGQALSFMQDYVAPLAAWHWMFVFAAVITLLPVLYVYRLNNTQLLAQLQQEQP